MHGDSESAEVIPCGPKVKAYPSFDSLGTNHHPLFFSLKTPNQQSPHHRPIQGAVDRFGSDHAGTLGTTDEVVI